MVYCAILSLICVTAFIGSHDKAGLIPFLCFLPMCFFFVATVTANLQREVRELREQVAKLQERGIGPNDAT
jgi:ABC-type transport system involved in cytochrome bd biosynthesis fused ATPase/permease subunit